MAENRHRLIMDDRSELLTGGVTEVEGFDDNLILLAGSFGSMEIHGQGLKIASLDLGEGKVSVSGRIDGILYAQAREEKKLRNKGKKALSRLLK